MVWGNREGKEEKADHKEKGCFDSLILVFISKVCNGKGEDGLLH